jgi:hypothetical protein
MEKTMMLITSTWGPSKTFKMMPISVESPYNEVIFDPDSKVLAVIGKEKKESMHMVAKLNEWGDPQTMKIGKRSNGKDYAEERKTLEAFYEYYIEDAKEITEFIKSVAVNADVFDYTSVLEAKNEKPSNLLTGI